MERLLTACEVSKLFQCHPQSVYRNKELPRVLIPGIGIRFKEKELNKYLEQRTINSPPNLQQLIHNQSFSLNNSPDYDIMVSKISGGIISEMAKAKSKTRINLGYGAIYQRKTMSGKIRWYLDYRDADGRRFQMLAKNAVTKDEAVVALREEVAKAFDKEYSLRRKREKIRFKEFADLYLQNYAMVKKRAWERSDKVYLNANLIPYFGNFEITKITPLLIERFIAKRREDGVKKSTINRDLACLRKMFNKAIDWEFLSKNPLAQIRLFSEQEYKRERILSKEEEMRLIEAGSEHIRPVILTSLHTGMRIGEILNLPWNQIDFSAKRIRVKKTKSGKARSIPINNALLGELMKLRSRNGQSPFVFFNPKTGKPLTSVKTAFKAACRRAGIKELTFHDMRRSFATRILQKGADIETVRSLLGHHSISVTQRYTHTDENRKREAVELLDEKTENMAKNRENLLHIRYAEKKGQKAKEVTDLFSIN